MFATVANSSARNGFLTWSASVDSSHWAGSVCTGAASNRGPGSLSSGTVALWSRPPPSVVQMGNKKQICLSSIWSLTRCCRGYTPKKSVSTAPWLAQMIFKISFSILFQVCPLLELYFLRYCDTRAERWGSETESELFLFKKRDVTMHRQGAVSPHASMRTKNYFSSCSSFDKNKQ